MVIDNYCDYFMVIEIIVIILWLLMFFCGIYDYFFDYL